MQRHRGE
jgi:DNA-directed RNA polymerase specialized sigma24 family protein